MYNIKWVLIIMDGKEGLLIVIKCKIKINMIINLNIILILIEK